MVMCMALTLVATYHPVLGLDLARLLVCDVSDALSVSAGPLVPDSLVALGVGRIPHWPQK
jgi:hypothetical protein